VRALPRIDWRVALKALAGFLAGLALWVFLTPLYNRVIAAGAEGVMRVFEKPAVTRLVAKDEVYVTVDRQDFDPRSKRPAIPLRDLTFNIVLLTALFAASKRTFSDRNIGGFLAAAAILALTHVLGTIAEVMSIYVAKLGLWSQVNYSDVERNLWGVANHFYRLVLMYAIAFALWFVFRDPATAAPAKAARSAKKKR
jgi:hypothetical protein